MAFRGRNTADTNTQIQWSIVEMVFGKLQLIGGRTRTTQGRDTASASESKSTIKEVLEPALRLFQMHITVKHYTLK